MHNVIIKTKLEELDSLYFELCSMSHSELMHHFNTTYRPMTFKSKPHGGAIFIYTHKRVPE